MDRLWWRVLTKHGSLEKGMANYISILVWRTPWTAWKGNQIGPWKMNSPVRWVPNTLWEFSWEITSECCSLAEQRPEPAHWLEHATNYTLVYFLAIMLNSHSWGGTCSPLHFTAYTCILLHGNKTIYCCSTAEPGLIILPSTPIPQWSHVTTASKSAG